MILGAFVSPLYHVVLLTPWRADWHLSIHRYSIVLISNQNLKSAELVNWKKKIPLIAAAVSIPPMASFAVVSCS